MRLIDADALMVSKQWENCTCPAQVIHNAPTIDPETLRPTGRWRKYSYDEWICTNCGYDKYCDTLDGGVLPKFCEECGAKMEG